MRALVLLLLGALAACRQQAPPPPASVPDAAPRAALAPEERARKLVALLAANKMAESHATFSARLKAGLGVEMLSAAWGSMVARVGPFERAERAVQHSRGRATVVVVTCRFAHGVINVQVAYDAAGEATGLFFRPASAPVAAGPERVPPYANRKAFMEKDLIVGAPPWELPATLSLPRAAGRKVPALVLVHGSGPHDRDETIGPNKPFRDLAWGLASRGIAVLRYEKRTKVHGAAMGGERITLEEETVADALAAVDRLRGVLGIDRGRIYVLGHSLGGVAVPRIGKRDPRIAGFVLLATNSRPMEDLVVAQFRWIAELDGRITGEERERLMAVEAAARRVKSVAPATPARELPLGAPASYWLDLQAHPHVAGMRELAQPLLFLQGGRDYQVTVVDLDGWKTALRGRPRVLFKLYPGLNHLFIGGGEGKPSPQDYERPGNVAPEVISEIAAFIQGAA